VISSNHGPMPTPDNLQEIIDLQQGLGTPYAVSGFWVQDFESLDAIKRTADKVNAVVEPLARAGVTFMLHNHWAEFQKVEGRIAYARFVELCPDVKFEIDTYWAAAFGANAPAEQVRLYRKRCPILHLKDGPFAKDQPMVACGKGKQDFAAIMKASDAKVLRWAVVELDQCATDMMQAVADSYTYLVGRGLVVGNVPVR
jgi:sugar phosphate isomerase/epimerase